MRNTYFSGLIVGILGSVFWGLAAIFFKQMENFLPLEIVAHRVFWTVILLAIFGLATARYSRLKACFTNWREFWSITLSAGLMALNWFAFIYSVATNQIVEAGLGYFIYPLMVVAVGVVFLREQLSRWEWVAVILAAIGVAIETYENGSLPMIAMTVSISFTGYTLLGKTRSTGPVVGVWAECIVLAPLALAYLCFLFLTGEGQFILGGGIDTSLAIFAGFVTAVPLILYITSSRTIGMATAGLIFYITPVLHVLVGTIIYGEPFTFLDGWAFGIIWIALTILTISQFRHSKTAGISSKSLSHHH
jgi:chloramphenicol-sensitive protein RarD